MTLDFTRPMDQWTMEQLDARYMQMWRELETALEEQNVDPPTLDKLVDSEKRAEIGLRSLRIRKITWEMGRVAEEWRSREGLNGSR